MLVHADPVVLDAIKAQADWLKIEQGLYNPRTKDFNLSSSSNRKGEPLPKQPSMQDAWTCEAIRNRETSWGPLEDRQAMALVAHETTPLGKIVARARALGASMALLAGFQTIRQASLIALLLAGLIAMAAGSSAALSSLGDGRQPVNVVWALASLIGINLISLLAWLVSQMLTAKRGGWIAEGWQWLTERLARGPANTLALQSWWSMWQRAGSQRWILSSVTHAIWCVATMSAIVVMLLALSARHFTFAWQTTLLSADVFVWLTQKMGWLPSTLGFLTPDTEVIHNSGIIASSHPDAQRAWSSWLIGCVVVYGLIPRLLFFLVSLWMIARARQRIGPDLSDPYYLQLVQRLQPAAQAPSGIAPADSVMRMTAHHHTTPTLLTDACLMTAIEPEADGSWPPIGIGTRVQMLSAIDSRASRLMVAHMIAASAPRKLAIAIDARHTPDRGTLRMIQELSAHAGQTLAWLRHGQDNQARTSLWQSSLLPSPRLQIVVSDQPQDVMKWFESC